MNNPGQAGAVEGEYGRGHLARLAVEVPPGHVGVVIGNLDAAMPGQLPDLVDGQPQHQEPRDERMAR